MKLKLQAKNVLKSATVIGMSLLCSMTGNAQTTVSIGSDAELVAYANWYQLDGTTYVAGDVWGLNDLKTTVNNDNTLTLYPNFSTYGTGEPGYWTNGDIGNKIFEGNTYVEANELIGQNVTFEGTTVANTLADGYEGVAFIKILSADFQLLQYLSVPLVTGQNFSITSQTANVAGAAFLQYGYSVTGLNANPAQEAALGNAIVSPETSGVDPVGTEVTIDTSSPLTAYANWFELDGTTYVAGDVWSLADLKTELNTENNTIILYPNYSTYGTGEPGYWTNGEIGNKVFEGNTYVENNALLGETVTFKGNTISNTLAEGYNAVAFIKVLSADYQLLQYLSVPLAGGENFSLTSETATISGAAIFQYGYSVTGLNANPNQESALGNAVVGTSSLSTPKLTTTSTKVYPNPVMNTLYVTSDENIDAVQVYNLLGQKVMESAPAQTTTAIDVTGLNSGVYIINTTQNGQVNSARFVKK